MLLDDTYPPPPLQSVGVSQADLHLVGLQILQPPGSAGRETRDHEPLHRAAERGRPVAGRGEANTAAGAGAGAAREPAPHGGAASPPRPTAHQGLDFLPPVS